MATATDRITADPLSVARDLASEIRAHSAEAERARTVAPAVMGELRKAGLLRLGLPGHLGGVRVPFPDIAATVEEIAAADTATAWCVAIGNTNAFLAWLDPTAAAALCDGPPVVAGSTAPTGTADPVSGNAVRLTGRWSFCSGVPHADVVVVGYRSRGASGPPADARVAFLPAASVTVHDTWDTMGLRGTASHDVSLADITVPLEHTASLHAGPAAHGDELHRLSPLNILMVLLAGVPLGAARRALEEMESLAAAKRRPGSRTPLLEDPEVLASLSRADTALAAARACVQDVLGTAWDVLTSGDDPTPALRARIAAATCHALETGRAAADVALRLMGTSALRTDHPLQRCVRDLHAAGQHFAFSDDMRLRHARTRYGLPQPFSLHHV